MRPTSRMKARALDLHWTRMHHKTHRGQRPGQSGTPSDWGGQNNMHSHSNMRPIQQARWISSRRKNAPRLSHSHKGAHMNTTTHALSGSCNKIHEPTHTATLQTHPAAPPPARSSMACLERLSSCEEKGRRLPCCGKALNQERLCMQLSRALRGLHNPLALCSTSQPRFRPSTASVRATGHCLLRQCSQPAAPHQDLPRSA